MKVNNILNGVTRAMSKAGLQLKKHSPEILVAAGLISGVATVVLACKATTKIDKVLDETKEKVDKIHAGVEMAEKDDSIDYSKKDGDHDLMITYAHTGLKLAKIYAPAIVTGLVSVTCILAGHNILRQRYVATAAAYAMVDRTFKDYRGRVIERFGKDLDRELRYNIKAQEIEEVVVNEKGEETVVKKTVDVVDPNTISMYSRFFDETCKGWERNAKLNAMFLLKTQEYFNDLLKARGHVFLNEVYDALGMLRDGVGARVGWYYDPSDPTRDNKIDFGIYDLHNADKRAFVNGYEPSILLEFNVDGIIYDLI